MRRLTRCKGNVASAEGRGKSGSVGGGCWGGAGTVFKLRDLSFNFKLRSSDAYDEEVSAPEGKMLLYVETMAKDCSRKISM